jgi:hypothetical protein
MSRKNHNLGKPVYQFNGYHVRPLVDRSTENKVTPTGRYVVCAGKKIVSDKDEPFKNKEEATTFLLEKFG